MKMPSWKAACPLRPVALLFVAALSLSRMRLLGLADG